MKHTGLLRFRMLVAMLMSAMFLVEAIHPRLLQPLDPSRALLAHGGMAVFGIAFLAQALFLERRLRLQS